ncbi:phosphotransferase family protein [Allonocardiopsis opalescens]|nr:phosphotransferase family protein [Allonocardiopsis opalescens]
MSDDPPGLDTGRLRAYLDREHPGFADGPLRAEVIAGGRSNLTYTVTDGRGRWVLRRPPLGHVLATAHDMGREYRVMGALAGSPVPVPRVHLHCPDPEVIGAPFYVMELVEGAVLRTPEQAVPLGRARAEHIARDLSDVLAALHSVPPAEVGLADFGRPDGYLHRQLARWRKQLDASRSRPLAGADELAGLLAGAVPQAQRAAVVHGDFRLDNCVVGPDDTVAAVLDWEMSTLGDPLADLGLLCVYWDRVGALPVLPLDTAVTPGSPFPSSERLVEWYAASSGLDLAPLPWYVAFGHFKLAVISEGIHFRHIHGQTVGEGFDRIGAGVEPLLAAGLATLGHRPDGAGR